MVRKSSWTIVSKSFVFADCCFCSLFHLDLLNNTCQQQFKYITWFSSRFVPMWHTISSQQPQSIHSAVSCLSPSAVYTEHHRSPVLFLLSNARIQFGNLVREWERFYVWMHPIIFALCHSAGYFWWYFTILSRSGKKLQQATWKIDTNHRGVSWAELCEPFVTMGPGGLLIAGIDNT